MADDERQNPPRKRARLNSDSPPRRRRREDDTNDTDANEPRGDAVMNVEPVFSAPGAALPFPLNDRDRASLFFRTFLVRMASPILQYTTGPPSQAPPLPTAIPDTEGRNMRDIARAVSAVVGGNMPSTVPQERPQQQHQDEGQDLPHRHGGEPMDVENEPTARHHDELVADAAVGVAMMAEEAGGHGPDHENDQENDHDHDGETVATEESNTDDEDLQQLSMVMCDGLLQQQNDALLAAQCYLPSEVSYEDVQHLIFHSAKEQKQVLIEKLFKLIKKTPNGGDTIARLVKAEDETGLTLLMISVRQELVALCQLLIEEGADVNQWNEKRPFALLLAAQKGNEGATRFLLEHGANDESKNMALIPAAHFGHLGVVGLLLEFGADQNYSNKKGTTPLMRAAQEGRDAVVQFLIDKGAVAYAANNEGMTALMLAAQRGHANIATILIRAGSDVDTQTRQGSTALLLAAKRGHTEAVEALLTAGADIFLKDDRHKTAADTAHRRGHIDLFLKITVSNQLRLMREALRRERYAELMRLSYLYVLSRATLVPAFKSPERHRLNVLLDRTMRLPRPLLQNIALFLPMCNVWERQLKYLVYEAPFHPSKVVQHGIRMLDDILVSVALDVRTSLQPFRQADTQYGGRHLALLRDNAEFYGVFTSECHVGICPDVLARLRRMADIQGALASYAAGTGIQFGVEVAQDVVALVADLLAWEDARKRLVFRTAATTYDEEDGMGSVRIKEEEPYRI